ncbi:MAG: hypothetical protein MI976_12255, partial [Pseudomonadales bacterium]|nr:hypothetical protein [Pseudomonadales bacterium]
MSCTYAKNQNLIKSLAVFIGLLFAICGTAHADKFNDRRVEVGLKLFRTLISADLNINTNINEQGLLRVLLIYVNDNQLALNHIKTLSNDFKAVNKIPISLQAYPIN